MDQVIEVTRHLSSKGIHQSIRSFIICISATIWGGTVFVPDGRLISCRSCPLGALLPSSPSWFLLLALVPSWSSSWVFNIAFFWRNYSSKSCFCLVRRSTATARVCTCLSKAVMHGSSPWMLLVVAINRVSTMQLFVREAFSMTHKSTTKPFPQTTPTNNAEKVTSEPHDTCTLKITHAQ